MALTTNLVAYYSFDSGNSNDSTANANNGSDAAGITYSSSFAKLGANGAQAGTAGTSQINLPSGVYSIANGQAAFSIAAWFKFSGSYSAGQNGATVANFSDGSGVVVFQVIENSSAPAGQVDWGIRDSGGSFHDNIYASQNLSAGTFYHVVYVYSGGVITAYINGAAVTTYSFTIKNTTMTSGYMLSRTSGSPVTPVLDEVGFWSRALSGAEVSQLYNGGAGLKYPFTSPTPLVFSVNQAVNRASTY